MFYGGVHIINKSQILRSGSSVQLFGLQNHLYKTIGGFTQANRGECHGGHIASKVPSFPAMLLSLFHLHQANQLFAH